MGSMSYRVKDCGLRFYDVRSKVYEVLGSACGKDTVHLQSGAGNATAEGAKEMSS